MKISAVDAFRVAPKFLFVRVRTDEGVTGWGEAGAQFRSRSVAAAVAELGGYLIGKDPLAIEAHWQMMRKSGFYRDGTVLIERARRPRRGAVGHRRQGARRARPRAARRPGPRPRQGLCVDRRQRLLRLHARGADRRDAGLDRQGLHGVQAHAGAAIPHRQAVRGSSRRRSHRGAASRRSAPTSTSPSTCTANGRKRWRAACCRCSTPIS